MVAASKQLFASWLSKPAPRFVSPSKGPDAGHDLVVRYGPLRMLVELKAAGDAATVARAANQLKAHAAADSKALPVLGVPYMGEVGKALCSQAGISWYDLSGNADISAPGLRILIEGKHNKFLRRGRPSTAFAPKSARIARRLLIDPCQAFRQQELAAAVGLDDGFTSRIVKRLVEDGLLARDKNRAIRVVDPDRLLDAWRETYDFTKHTLIKGVIAARESGALVQLLGEAFEKAGLKHAATGLAGAWRLSPFAGFRIATFFVEQRPSDEVMKALYFREEPRGANVWLAVPNDEGVFDGAREVDGVSCAHPVQVYLDLLGHPERAQEAAVELRKQLLSWKAHE
jgi:hypothetical protein